MSGILSQIATNYNATPPVTYATWNPADKGSGLTLSNGNLTVASSSNISESVRATIGKSSGKWYWETTVNTNSNVYGPSGVSNTSASLSTYPGGDTNGWGCRIQNYSGSSYYDAFYNNSAAPYFLIEASLIVDNVSVIGYALDMDAGTLQIYRDGVLKGTTATGITGTVYPAFGTFNSTAGATVNFGATPFAYTPPVGFNAGLYE